MQKIERSSRKLVNNVIASAMYQVLIMIVPIITTPYVTRIFLPEQMGQYGLSLALASIFVILANAGMALYGSREIAQSRNETERNIRFNNLWNIQIVNTVFWSILYLLYVNLFTNRSYLYFFQVGLIIVSSLDISWFYMGIEGIKNNIYRNFVTKLFVTVTIFLIIRNENDLILYTMLNILGMLLGNISMFIGLKRYVNIRIKIPNDFFMVISKSYKLMYTQLVGSLQAPAERSILNILSKSTLGVGIYDQGIKIINLIFSVVNSGINALMPRMSFEVSEGNMDKVKQYAEKVLVISCIFSVFIVSGIYNVADSFVLFFFGRGYAQVAIVLKITCLSLLFMPLSSFMSNGILIPLKKDKIALKSAVIVTITSVFLNFILDAKLTIYGISIAFVASVIVGFIYRLAYTRNIFSLKKCISYIILSALMIIMNIGLVSSIKNLLLVDNNVVSFFIFGFISVLINVIIYSGMYMLRKLFYMNSKFR